MANYKPIPAPDDLKKISPQTRAYQQGQLTVFISIEYNDLFEQGIERRCWHLSIAHPDRYPTWDEIKEARDMFLATEKTGYMLLPKPSDYVNVHQNCFHIWMIAEDGENDNGKI